MVTPSASSRPAAAALAAVVLNWNGLEDTLDCLRSIRTSTVAVRSIVVDNGSTDDSVGRIAASGLADVLLPAGENLGYAEGTNVGLRRALRDGHEIVIVLNNDTVVRPDALALLAEALHRGGPAAVSPDIRFHDRPEESWFAGGTLARGWPLHVRPSDLPPSAEPLRPSEFLTGCCIAAHRQTWARVGLFDQSFFLIFEDSDWSWRAARCGVRLAVVPKSIVLHKVSRSFTAGPASLLGSFYFARNGLRFEARYLGRSLVPFAMHWIVKPTLRLADRREGAATLLFLWLGVLAFACRHHGRAPRIVERLATRLAARQQTPDPTGQRA